MKNVCVLCSGTLCLTWMSHCVFHQKSLFCPMWKVWKCTQMLGLLPWRVLDVVLFQVLVSSFNSVWWSVSAGTSQLWRSPLVRLSLLHYSQVFRKESAYSGLWVLCLVVCIHGLTLSLRTLRWLGMTKQSLMMKTVWKVHTCFHWSSRPTVCQGKCFSKHLICNGRADTLRLKFIGSESWWIAKSCFCHMFQELWTQQIVLPSACQLRSFYFTGTCLDLWKLISVWFRISLVFAWTFVTTVIQNQFHVCQTGTAFCVENVWFCLLWKKNWKIQEIRDHFVMWKLCLLKKAWQTRTVCLLLSRWWQRKTHGPVSLGSLGWTGRQEGREKTRLGALCAEMQWSRKWLRLHQVSQWRLFQVHQTPKKQFQVDQPQVKQLQERSRQVNRLLDLEGNLRWRRCRSAQLRSWCLGRDSSRSRARLDQVPSCLERIALRTRRRRDARRRSGPRSRKLPRENVLSRHQLLRFQLVGEMCQFEVFSTLFQAEERQWKSSQSTGSRIFELRNQVFPGTPLRIVLATSVVRRGIWVPTAHRRWGECLLPRALSSTRGQGRPGLESGFREI